MSSRAIVVFEGRHDVAAFTAISQRHASKPSPATYGVRLVESEGHTEVVKICRLARQLGFRVIVGLDFDKSGQGADTSFTEAQQVADDVIRLPERFAIEMALVHGVPRQSLLDAFTELDEQWRLGLADMDQHNDRDLDKRLTKALHKSGVHAQHVHLLAGTVPPKVAIRFLDQAVELARGTVTGPVTFSANQEPPARPVRLDQSRRNPDARHQTGWRRSPCYATANSMMQLRSKPKKDHPTSGTFPK